MTNAEGEAALGHLDRIAVQRAAQALVASGDAEVEGETFRLLPPLCDEWSPPPPVTMPADAPARARALLAERPGCALALPSLAALLVEGGLAAASADAAIGALAREGVLEVAGGQGRLVPCAGAATELPARPSADVVAAVRALDGAGVREAVAAAMPGLGCRLPGDPAAAGPLVVRAVLDRLGGGPDAPRLAEVLLARRVAEVLDNPGPLYETDPATGELVFLHCAP